LACLYGNLLPEDIATKNGMEVGDKLSAGTGFWISRNFRPMDFTILSRQKRSMKGGFFDVQKVLVRLPDGREHEYDLVSHSGGGDAGAG